MLSDEQIDEYLEQAKALEKRGVVELEETTTISKLRSVMKDDANYKLLEYVHDPKTNRITAYNKLVSSGIIHHYVEKEKYYELAGITFACGSYVPMEDVNQKTVIKSKGN